MINLITSLGKLFKIQADTLNWFEASWALWRVYYFSKKINLAPVIDINEQIKKKIVSPGGTIVLLMLLGLDFTIQGESIKTSDIDSESWLLLR